MLNIADYVYTGTFWLMLNVIMVIILIAVVHSIFRTKSAAKVVEEDREYNELMALLRRTDFNDQKDMLKTYMNAFIKYLAKSSGIEVKPGTTTREFIAAMVDRRISGWQELSSIYGLYEQARFGEREMSEEDLGKLRVIMMKVATQLRGFPTPQQHISEH